MADARHERRTALDEARQEFHDELIGAGLLFETSGPGIYGQSAEFESVVAGIEGIIGAAFAHLSTRTWVVRK